MPWEHEASVRLRVPRPFNGKVAEVCMNELLLAISIFKIGIYVPAGVAPMKAWPYIAAGMHQDRLRPWGIEVGFSEEPKRTVSAPLGRPGWETVYLPTFMVGVTKGITNNDLDIAVGAKMVDRKAGPYAGITFRFSSAVEASKDHSRRPL